MKKIFEKTFDIMGRAYDSLIPDEETGRRLSKMYAAMFRTEDIK